MFEKLNAVEEDNNLLQKGFDEVGSTWMKKD